MIIKGQKINDRYQIIRTIGEGGMANVYLAYDTILDRNVAVKILRGDLSTDEKFVRRFQREAISASSLSHPNIVEMYDVGEDDGKYFIVMEYIDGKTLKNLVKKRGALTLPEVIDIMIQLTSALACAHDSYIIHRDIKPQNVMILDDGRVKITDFGIAIASNAAELTQTNSVMGSVHYLPPEQANGEGATVKSDIYSLGILMFELLTGKVPFKGDNAVEIALKQMKERIPRVTKINEEIPQSVENVILKACAKNPKNRYESVREMYLDLKTSLDDERRLELEYTYSYPEDDLEITKEVEVRSKKEEKKRRIDSKTEEAEEKIEVLEASEEVKKVKKKVKWLNVALWITGGIVALLAIGLCIAILLLPKSSETKDVKIPEVSGFTVEEAEEKLIAAGLTVDIELGEKASDEIKEGLVIETSPKANRTVKEGQKIKIVVSIGSEKIIVEDYTNKNYLEIKGALEAKGLVVKIEKKRVEEKGDKKYNPDLIIEQSIKPGEKIKKDDEITLIIPEIVIKFPDFTKGYTVEQFKEWCKERDVIYTIDFLESIIYAPNIIVSQSRPEGSEVGVNGRISITVTMAPLPEPEEPEV